MRKTKIVCTVGPATDRDDILEQLILAGMDVSRSNFSHGSHEEHKGRMDKVKAIRKKYNKPVAILLDTKGPEIRIKEFENGKINLVNDEIFTLKQGDEKGNEKFVCITSEELYRDVNIGTKILIDDGLVELKVHEIKGTDIECKVVVGGQLSDKKGINVPEIHLSMEYLSDKDKEDLIFGIKEDVDFVAASFVRNADDVKKVREFLKENGGEKIQIISKIENDEGVKNIDEIIKYSDGIMVARGDMGVEIPFEEVPAIQKMIIKKVYQAGKMVITATQMLDSMIKNPRPTRAEATDVANAIYDGTSAIMLSGETAAGSYPVEALMTMARIAEQTEKDIDYRKRFFTRDREANPNVTDAISHATCTTALDLNAKAIITVTKTGNSARMLSRYRPESKIIACTTDEKTYRQLNLSWGVVPQIIQIKTDVMELFDVAVRKSEESGLVNKGDITVITSGIPLGVSGTTNMIKVHEV